MLVAGEEQCGDFEPLRRGCDVAPTQASSVFFVVSRGDDRLHAGSIACGERRWTSTTAAAGELHHASDDHPLGHPAAHRASPASRRAARSEALRVPILELMGTDVQQSRLGLCRRASMAQRDGMSQGFTLLELMIVLTLVSVILAIGAPSFGDFSRNNRLTSAANNLLAGLQLARTEAIKRQRIVSICTSDNADGPSPTCSSGTFSGWIVFEDSNGDCARTADEPLPLRSGEALPNGLAASQDGRCASFSPNGQVRAGGGQALLSHAIFCDERGLVRQPGTGLSVARGVELTPTGRSLVTRDPSRINSWAMACVAS